MSQDLFNNNLNQKFALEIQDYILIVNYKGHPLIENLFKKFKLKLKN